MTTGARSSTGGRPVFGGPQVGRVLGQATEYIATGPRGLVQAVADGWVNTGNRTDEVTFAIDGQMIRVIRLNDDDGLIYDLSVALTSQDWENIYNYGASFGGTVNLAPAPNGDIGCFVGLQCNSAEIPAAAGAPFVGTNRRWGFFIQRDTAGNNEFFFGGVDGSPLTSTLTGVLADKWMEYALKIGPNFGPATLLARERGDPVFQTIDAAVPFNVNGGGTGTQIILSSGSSAGTNRVTHHLTFGATIYEASNVLQLNSSHFVGMSQTEVIIPSGARDWIVNVAADVPVGVPVGYRLSLLTQNLGGIFIFRDVNAPSPIITINRLNEVTFPINKILFTEIINQIGGKQEYALDVSSLGVTPTLSFATYTLTASTDPGAGALPRGPLGNWRRQGDFNVSGIEEIIGIVTIDQWRLAPGRWKLTAQLRLNNLTISDQSSFGWHDVTNNDSGIGGESSPISMDFATSEGASNLIVAIVEIDAATVYQINQVSGDDNTVIQAGGSWATIEQLA